MIQLTTRQRLLQVQQDLIELVPDSVNIELLPNDEVRLTTVRKGGRHPNHTYLSVFLLHDNSYSVVRRKGRKQVNRVTNYSVTQEDMHKQVMSNLHVLGVWVTRTGFA